MSTNKVKVLHRMRCWNHSKAPKEPSCWGHVPFWEGVDIPGEALSILVIAKLPFAVPSDPLVAARSETFEDPFNEYHLPEAILRFRQGFGRLIRTQSDRGVVVILDRRVLTKSYGKLFIEVFATLHLAGWLVG